MLEQPVTQDKGNVIPLILRTGLKSSPESVRRVLALIKGALLRAGVTEALAHSVEIALAEALNNVVEHAYAGNTEGEVNLSVDLGDAFITVEIVDSGVPLPDRFLAFRRRVTLPNRREDMPEGGVGWPILSDLTSQIRYARKGPQNHLVLVFKRL